MTHRQVSEPTVAFSVAYLVDIYLLEMGLDQNWTTTPREKKQKVRRDKSRVRGRRYDAANREKRRAAQGARNTSYYAANKDRINAERRAKRAAERRQLLQRANPASISE